ncbi:hypothetical protein [Euzebyella saccharophila]|uniref:Uncharacterized protein n=1 Tax=Euzebyella saccharophila TaxID=679664 RepID=A0ABV8JT45_9FLAO|nr:hypothetical protein [Euzebyella saccharophila]
MMMKTSLILLLALLFNTTLIFAESLLSFVQAVHPAILFAVEGILIAGYSPNRFLGDFSKAMEISFDSIEVFVYKKRR